MCAQHSVRRTCKCWHKQGVNSGMWRTCVWVGFSWGFRRIKFKTRFVSVLQWHRMPTTQETDGFQVKRPGDVNVKCTLLLMLDHQVCVPTPTHSICWNYFPWTLSLLPKLPIYFPAPSVQTGPTACSPSGRAHADTGEHHASSLALHQEQQAAGRSWEGVHQLQPLLQTSNERVLRGTVTLIK